MMTAKEDQAMPIFGKVWTRGSRIMHMDRQMLIRILCFPT